MKKKCSKPCNNSSVEKLINLLDDERIVFDFEHYVCVIRHKIERGKNVKNV